MTFCYYNIRNIANLPCLILLEEEQIVMNIKNEIMDKVKITIIRIQNLRENPIRKEKKKGKEGELTYKLNNWLISTCVVHHVFIIKKPLKY